jgi:uncharacterized repeat protein (TIGR03803 family)
VNSDGTGFTILHIFNAGEYPVASLALSGNALYGTVGANTTIPGDGSIFKINVDGSGFTNLHSFVSGTDGANPQAGLILVGTALYGTAYSGGSYSSGTVFRMNTNGSGFTNLYSFTATAPYSTNSDGINPSAGLISANGTLFGTSSHGGAFGSGTVFKVHTNGMGFVTLHSFSLLVGDPTRTNEDGANPCAGLTLLGNTLYGTSKNGGSGGNGTLFCIQTNGSGFTVLHSFTPTVTDPTTYTPTNADGANPCASLTLIGNDLWGTAAYGGTLDSGTIFKLSLPALPPLKIARSGAGVALTWPTNVPGYTLQSSTNLFASTIWSDVTPGPAIINGQNSVSNSTSAPRTFFRLRR